MNLNDRISEIITYSQFTSSEFADEIDVQRSNISHITSGRNKPSLDFLMKIKERFPELQWDWIIFGKGEMVIKKEIEPIVEKTKSPTLPDLFSLINDENFGLTESEDKISKNFSRESEISVQSPVTEKISDSHRLATEEKIAKQQISDNQSNKIKRIVFFFENGKFETFEP